MKRATRVDHFPSAYGECFFDCVSSLGCVVACKAGDFAGVADVMTTESFGVRMFGSPANTHTLTQTHAHGPTRKDSDIADKFVVVALDVAVPPPHHRHQHVVCCLSAFRCVVHEYMLCVLCIE